ncbi:aldehyde ferredoxin oxidoreductase, partial [Candidatus Bathyarchaeota archaeon]
MFGWMGKLLRIDLSTQQIKEERIPESVLSHYIGGKGLGTYFLYHEVPAGIDALSPENRFYLAAGPLQGTRIPITGRCSAISKSPLTQLYIDSGMGGYLGPELKRAGYDLLIIQGHAEKPVWININEDGSTIEDASHFWGKTTHETEAGLRKEDPKSQVISTGPAGERLVRFACLTHNYFRNFGRGGLGAVFGAKNLKAIAIRGSRHRISTPDPDIERELVKQLAQRARAAKEKGHSLHYTGTPWLVDYSNSIGMFPTRNFQATHFEGHKKISDESLEKVYHKNKRRMPCEGCVISCAWTVKEPDHRWVDKNVPGIVALPEYETLGLIGGNLGIDDPVAITRANYLCNRLGLDTISTGNVIGFLMELTQRRLLPKGLQTNGIEFGDAESVIKLIPQIAARVGIGEQLAKGVREFASELGPKVTRLALHTKGLEYPAWDPRGKLGLGLSYATAAAGASHLRGWPSTTKPPEVSAVTILDSLIEQQNLKILKDSLVICHFTHSISPRLSIKDCVTLYSAATGEDTSLEAIEQIANRIWMLARMFNIREYKDTPRKYDLLPYRFMHDPVPDGPTKGYTSFTSQQDFEDSLTELY